MRLTQTAQKKESWLVMITLIFALGFVFAVNAVKEYRTKNVS